MHSFDTGLSAKRKAENWKLLSKAFRKRRIPLEAAEVEAVMAGQEGAAVAVVRRVFEAVHSGGAPTALEDRRERPCPKGQAEPRQIGGAAKVKGGGRQGATPARMGALRPPGPRRRCAAPQLPAAEFRRVPVRAPRRARGGQEVAAGGIFSGLCPPLPSGSRTRPSAATTATRATAWRTWTTWRAGTAGTAGWPPRSPPAPEDTPMRLAT